MIAPELDTKHQRNLDKAIKKMQAAGVDTTAIKVFASQYHALVSGATGIIREADIVPVKSLLKHSDIKVGKEASMNALRKTAVIKLNGGLGTSMGLNKAKTLLPVRDNKTFLDIMIGQILHTRKETEARLPLIFMNSFRTRGDTAKYLEKYTDIRVGKLPMDFLQNSNPKIYVDDLSPAEWPEGPELEWNPPGHGDVYPALWSTGILDELIKEGFEYAFISNGDNLGATVDGRIAGWFEESGASFAMEVCRRSVNDRKGGHLAVRKSDGRIILRESAQTALEEMEYFADENLYTFFNTNNIWINLRKLRDVLEMTDGILELPLIRNLKTVDPTRPESPEVIQLESAMGSAIEIFEGATAIEVPRSRFMPVKTTNELLLMRSDAFEIDDAYQVKQKIKKLPRIDLDSRYYKFIDDFNKRLKVIPSLKSVNSLKIVGDHVFDKPLHLTGDVLFSDDSEE